MALGGWVQRLPSLMPQKSPGGLGGGLWGSGGQKGGRGSSEWLWGPPSMSSVRGAWQEVKGPPAQASRPQPKAAWIPWGGCMHPTEDVARSALLRHTHRSSAARASLCSCSPGTVRPGQQLWGAGLSVHTKGLDPEWGPREDPWEPQARAE